MLTSGTGKLKLKLNTTCGKNNSWLFGENLGIILQNEELELIVPTIRSSY